MKYQLIRIFLKRKKCVWSLKRKNFCTVFYHTSITAYRFMRKLFNQHSYQTIFRNLDNSIVKPGFSESIEIALKNSITNLEEKDRDIMIV